MPCRPHSTYATMKGVQQHALANDAPDELSGLHHPVMLSRRIRIDRDRQWP